MFLYIISISKLLGNYNQRHPGLVSESGTPYFIVYLGILRNLINSDKLQSHGLSIHVSYFRLLKMGAGFIYVRRRHMVNYHFQDKFYIKCMQNDYIMNATLL